MPISIKSVDKMISALPLYQRKFFDEFRVWAIDYRHTGEGTVANYLHVGVLLCRYLGKKKHLEDLTSEELLRFLNQRRKSEEEDHNQRWIRTWNDYYNRLKAIYRYHCNKDSDIPESSWKNPYQFDKIKMLKNKRKSSYSAGQVWTQKEVLTVTKYGNNNRDKAILTLMYDIVARNHEITSLRLNDLQFYENYTEITIPWNTKTGARTIPLGASFPYLRDWLNEHPFKNQPDAFLFLNLHNGKPLKPNTIWNILQDWNEKIKRMLADDVLPQEDREILSKVVKKPWNPYLVGRHSSLTEKARYLSDYELTVYAGWVEDTKRRGTYLHLSGDISKKPLLKHYGIEEPEKREPLTANCPRCKYVNTVHSSLCKSCGFVLSIKSWEKEKSGNAKMQTQIDDLQSQMKEMQQQMRSRGITFVKPVPLTEEQITVFEKAGIPIDRR